jgi:hypothetical protein
MNVSFASHVKITTQCSTPYNLVQHPPQCKRTTLRSLSRNFLSCVVDLTTYKVTNPGHPFHTGEVQLRRCFRSQQYIKLLSLLKMEESAMPGRADLPVISWNICMRLLFDNISLKLAKIDTYASSVCRTSESRTNTPKHTLPKVESSLNGPFRSGLVAVGSLCKEMPLSRS